MHCRGLSQSPGQVRIPFVRQCTWRLLRLALVQPGRWRWMIPLALALCGCGPRPAAHRSVKQRPEPVL